MRTLILLLVLGVIHAAIDFNRLGAAEPLLRPNDRVALLGGTFIERMQSSGALEAELQCRRPDWQMSVRNIGWSGDDVHGMARKRFDSPADGFKRLLSDVETAKATVVLVAYGFSEASDGAEAVENFAPGLRKLVRELRQDDRRVILMTPFVLPGYRTDRFEHWIDRCRAAVQQVGQETETPVLDVSWRPNNEAELTEDRLLPSDLGYANFSHQIAGSLVGSKPCERWGKEMQQQIVDKNQLFFHRYRPQNETYLFLFRKHEQGNNAVEIPQFDPLIQQADEAIWRLAGEGK